MQRHLWLFASMSSVRAPRAAHKTPWADGLDYSSVCVVACVPVLSRRRPTLLRTQHLRYHRGQEASQCHSTCFVFIPTLYVPTFCQRVLPPYVRSLKWIESTCCALVKTPILPSLYFAWISMPSMNVCDLNRMHRHDAWHSFYMPFGTHTRHIPAPEAHHLHNKGRELSSHHTCRT